MEINFGVNKWKISSYVIGGISIGITLLLFCLLHDKLFRYFLTIFIPLVINIIATTFWVCGAALNKTFLMLIVLIWWAIPVMFCLGCTAFVAFEIAQPPSSLEPLVFVFVIIVTVAILVIYTLAVLCFVKLKKAIERSRSEIPRMNVQYSTAKTTDFDYY